MLEEEEPPMKTLAGAQQEEERKGATASPRWNKSSSLPSLKTHVSKDDVSSLATASASCPSPSPSLLHVLGPASSLPTLPVPASPAPQSTGAATAALSSSSSSSSTPTAAAAVKESPKRGLKWFQRRTPPLPGAADKGGKPAAAATTASVPQGSDGANNKRDSNHHQPPQQQQEKHSNKDNFAPLGVETICPVSYVDLKRQLDMLKRENNRLRFENSYLFKELDIVHRRLSFRQAQRKSGGSEESLLDVLSSQTTFSYNIDSTLTLKIPLNEFLEHYGRDYPESFADLTIFQRMGKLASFTIRDLNGGASEGEQSILKTNLENALISQEDGKAQQNKERESFFPTIVKRQFARDVPSMIRINGKMLSGRTENEKVMIAHRILYDGLDGNEKLINLVMSLANQNLGIFMYEKLVRHYTQIGMIVKQSWHHYVDICLSRVKISQYLNNKYLANELVDDYLRKQRAERELIMKGQTATLPYQDQDAIFVSYNEEVKDMGESKRDPCHQQRRRAESQNKADSIDEDKAKLIEGISIFMLAIFELQNADLDSAPLFIKGMMEIRFRNTAEGGLVHVMYSAPAFDVLSFVHSIDLDSESESESEQEEGEEERRKQQERENSNGESDGRPHASRRHTGGASAPGDERGERAKMKEVHGDELGGTKNSQQEKDLLPSKQRARASTLGQEKVELCSRCRADKEWFQKMDSIDTRPKRG